MGTEIAKATGNFGTQTLELVVETDDVGSNACAVKLRATLGAETCELSLVVSDLDANVTFSVPAVRVSGTLAGCLAACGLTAVRPVIDCAKKHKKIADFKTCVQGKGLSIAASAVECLLICLGAASAVP
jgi:hypothetical protein